MSSYPAIFFDQVSKKFELAQGAPRTVQEQLLALVDRRRRVGKQDMWAVKDVSFAVNRDGSMWIASLEYANSAQ